MLPIVLLLIVSQFNKNKNLDYIYIYFFNPSGCYGYCLFGILYATSSRSIYVRTMVNAFLLIDDLIKFLVFFC